jgi:sugar/nucleoside kinase (ribokinase family)
MKKTIIGSGIYMLDSIVLRDYPEWPRMRPFTDRKAIEEVGGTCGNVMCILAWLGWKAMPQVCLDDSPEGYKVAADLAEYGCDCRYVTNTPGGGTTILLCTHKRDADGGKKITFRAGSPGGSRFPKRHFLRARDEAPEFLDSLEEAPGIYFFDDPAAGHRLIAGALREKGTLVYFEPSKIESKADLEAISVSDIVKFSGENIPDASFTDRFPDKLFIQTLGPDGLRFKLRGGSWVHVPPVPCDEVVDWEGAGDWTTSTFLARLGDVNKEFVELTEEMVADALKAAQTAAAQSVRYLSSKGMIHAEGQPAG